MGFKTKAPFGVSCKRFDGIGFHPGLDPQGTMKKDKGKLAPGVYNPHPHECAYKKYHVAGTPWKRKADMEEYSLEMGFTNDAILEQRRFLKSLGGPGLYDISEEVFKKKSNLVKRDVGFGTQERFFNPLKHDNPPPGTYGKNLAETSMMTHKQFTPLPIFEWDGFVSRFKDPEPPWTKAPNRYDVKDCGSIDALLSKVVSKRGPYDLFTGPRDGSTIKNYFAPPLFKGPKNWIYTWPNELELLLHHPKKRLNGKFLKAARFGYKAPNTPGPATYSIECEKQEKINKYAFNMSVVEARPGIKWKIYPGIGRYFPKYPSCIQKSPQRHRPNWIFISKTGRTVYKAPEYNSF